MPEQIGRYHIVGELGKGAMGVVYKASDPTIGRTVALKTTRLDVHGLDSEELLRRFRNEARAAGVLSHANIVTIYDAGEGDGMFYIAMEFIEGHTLQEVLAKRPVLPSDELIGIVRQICAGLDYAHAHGVVHRDIKPANVMIAPDGTVKIMDFGIAKAGASLTNPGQVLGTPNYMSPEQVCGRSLDGRTDLFSLGVVLYEMVTGRRPFTGETITTIIYKIVNEEPVPPRELDASVHPALSAVVLKALAKSPEARFQTGAELAQALAEYKAAAAISASFENAPTAEFVAVAQPTIASAAAAGAAAPAPRTVKIEASPTPVAAQAPVATAAMGSAAASKLEAPPAPPARHVVAAPARARTPVERKKSPLVWVVVGVLVLVLGGVGAKLKQWQNRRPSEVAQQPVQLPPLAPPQSTEAPPTTQKAEPPVPVTPSQAAPEQRAAAPPHVELGEVKVASSPDGAIVQIDGRIEPNWTTPFQARLKPGRHTLTFNKPGFKSETVPVEIRADKLEQVRATLTAMASAIAFTSDPGGAFIYIDGQDTGQTTPAQVTVQPGQHDISLRKAGFQPMQTLADVGPGQTLNLDQKLVPQAQKGNFLNLGNLGVKAGKKGWVIIRTTPPGAQVSVADRQIRKLTPLRFPAPAGDYLINVTMDGYRPAQRQLHVEAGQVTVVDVALQRR